MIVPVVGQDSSPHPEVTEAPGVSLEVERYETLRLAIPVDPSLYRNPFDPDDIEILGLFQSPDGREIVIPGFWMQPYVDLCEQPCEVENLQPVGEPVWQVRFSPQVVGEWSYVLQVRDNGAVVDSQAGQFNVVPSIRKGFIRVGKNGRYFQHENGQPYFPIGHNLLWSWEAGGGLLTYQRWLQELSDSGGNYARLVIDTPWFIGLEWQRPVGDYSMAQAEAARLDAVLDTAEENDIALQLVLLWHQALRYYSEPPVLIPDTPPRPAVSADWTVNPYNILNGGPLSGPGVFFFDETARKLFRQRLRYIVARWGYSSQIFAWEIVDQIDRTANYDPEVANAWLQDTISYLRQIDRQGHLITVGSREFDPVLAANPLLDFTQGTFYQRRPFETVSDQVLGILDVVQRNLRSNSVPTLLSSYSLNPWFEPTEEDPEGIHFQNTLWAAALSGAAGGGMSDWWHTYVIPQGLERYYRPLAAFAVGIDWSNLDLQQAQAGLLSEDDAIYTAVRISDFNRQFREMPSGDIVVTITADGAFSSLENVPAYLYGKIHNQQYSQPHTYIIAPPVATYVEVRVRGVSSDFGARLQATVDNQVMAELDLPPGTSDVTMRIPLGSGEHRVVLDNVGEDWLELESIEVEKMVAPARVLTVRDSIAGVALSWLQHRDYTWEQVQAGVERQPLALQYQLDKLPPGRYRTEIWEPLTGAVLGEEWVEVAADGILTLDLLPFDTQSAIRIFRQSDLPVVTPTLDAVEIPTVLPEITPTVSPVPSPPTEVITPTLEATSPIPLLIYTNTPRPTEAED